MKKIIVILLGSIVIIGIVIFIKRYEIFQYSAEKIILNILPRYLKIDGIDFNLKKNHIFIRAARIANAADFSESPILEVESISCRYKLRSPNPIDGIDITELIASRPILRIERRSDGKINIEEMGELKDNAPPQSDTAIPKDKALLSQMTAKKPSELLGLPDAIKIVEGRVIFTDNALYNKPYVLTFDNINASVSLKLNEAFSRILSVKSTGSGNVNRRTTESIDWNISLDPTRPKLTMSNNFKVSRVSALPFQPYFLRFSPFIFRSGRFSGNIVLDFDNGNIGSTNTVSLEDLSFAIREGFEGAAFWQTTVPDLVKYLASSEGAVVFDFKIKGPMQNPHFYLGPITKRALAEMAVRKIGEAVTKAVKGEGSDLEKVQGVIDIFKGMMKKK